jgi:hypothetical protein
LKIAAICLGILLFGGAVLIAVANASSSHSNAMGPLAFLLCIAGVAVMIVLGVTFGGRGRSSAAAHEPAAQAPETPAEGDH